MKVARSGRNLRTRNEPITTGDLSADRVEGPLTFEVEGSERTPAKPPEAPATE